MPELLKLVIVTDGLKLSDDGVLPHPNLHAWHRRMARAGKRWTYCSPKTAVEWYLWATKQPCSPAAFLASCSTQLSAEMKQCWIASPYCAVVARDHVNVVPALSSDWTEKNALRLADLLNPLLEECGMMLIPSGPVLLVCCNRTWDVEIQSFAVISGGQLPDRMPPGCDAGDMMRLLSEIQMFLAGQDAGPAISGLWFWGATDWPAVGIPKSLPGVITDDRVLSSAVNDEQASFAVTSAAGAENMLKANKPPRFWLLAGGGQCVLLDCRSLPRLGRNVWRPGHSVSLARMRKEVPIQ